ncbi:MAG: response regulator transcription factor [Planctomycetota bacterium]|nr:response regulator transcription factor [Planctomycetota bacterium]
MARQKVLVVDDEEDILELIEYNLAKQGFQVSCVTSGEDGVKVARTQVPDLVVLDLMLPGLDGLEVCRTLKADPKTKGVPVLMLTAKGEESDVIRGLECGADDYITKPFSPRVLVARVKAALRRGSHAPEEPGAAVTLGQLAIHPGRHEVVVAGEKIDLTFTEFRILHLLARRPGWVFTRAQIVEGVQGQDVAVTDRSVDVHIVSLRRKLGPVEEYLETVRGVGYRMKDI